MMMEINCLTHFFKQDNVKAIQSNFWALYEKPAGAWGVQALGFCKEPRGDLICKRCCLNKVVVHKCNLIGNEETLVFLSICIFFLSPLVSLWRRSRRLPAEEILLFLLPPPVLPSCSPLPPLNYWSHAHRVCQHRYNQTQAQAGWWLSLELHTNIFLS